MRPSISCARLPEDTALRVEAVAEYFRILGRDQVPADQLKDTFAEIAAENIALQDRLRRIESDDARVQELREQAAEALEVGDHGTAKATIHEAREVRRAVLKELAEMAAEEARGLADLTAEEARVELARRKFAAAAALFDEAASELAPHDVPAARSHLRDAADAWLTQGDRRGDNTALETSIARWERVIEISDREADRDDWASALNNFGNALQTLGKREPGTARLEEAVTAYRLALDEQSHDRVPLDWARTQNNLGNALEALGAREPGTARLEEAVTAYRLALEEWTRDRVPLDWAMTQNNLGNALRTLGEREPGTARLEEAVTAYHLALEERTRDRVPLDWAVTRFNTGILFLSIAERSEAVTDVRAAEAAFQHALEVFAAAGNVLADQAALGVQVSQARVAALAEPE